MQKEACLGMAKGAGGIDGCPEEFMQSMQRFRGLSKTLRLALTV